MEIFNSLFYRKSKLMIVTGVPYAIILVLFLIALFVGTVNQYYYQLIIFSCFLLLMTVRALYFIFEKIIVDKNEHTITLKILKKKFDITKIKAIRKVRDGQIRIINLENKEYPVSIENEDKFIATILELNPSISVF